MPSKAPHQRNAVRFEPRPVDDGEVRTLYVDFIAESDGPLGIDVAAEAAAGPPGDLEPPGGGLLLVRVDGEAAGLGGVRHLDTGVAEVKSMYMAPAFRGRGISRRLLAELEAIAARHGCSTVRLDSSGYLSAALALYRSAGYREVPDYNGNPIWFERQL
jgi:GNAT superfamily N-acetyltransferase